MQSRIFTGLCLLLLVSLLMSCENQQMNFSESQPRNSRIQKKFKKGYTGEYLSMEDSVSVLYVSKNSVIRHNKFRTKIHREDLDTMQNVDIQGNKITFTDEGLENKKWDLNWQGDSAVIVATFSIDTLFQISEQNLLKYDNKKYFLNSFIGNDLWNVDIMLLNKDDQLTICGLSGEEEVIEDIEKIFPVSQKMDIDHDGTTIYVERISKKEFRELLKLKAVYIRGEYQKIK